MEIACRFVSAGLRPAPCSAVIEALVWRLTNQREHIYIIKTKEMLQF